MDTFNREPIRRLAWATATHKAFLDSQGGNFFHFQVNLESTPVYRNSYPFAASPLQTDNDKELYLNSIEALAFENHGHGVPFADFPYHYI